MHLQFKTKPLFYNKEITFMIMVNIHLHSVDVIIALNNQVEKYMNIIVLKVFLEYVNGPSAKLNAIYVIF